jgi:hypothetical protein
VDGEAMIFIFKLFAIAGVLVFMAGAFMFSIKLVDLAWRIFSRIGLALAFIFLTYLLVCAVCLL